MSGISSGLVAVAWMTDREVQYFGAKDIEPYNKEQFPLVRLSDAEAIIAQKDAEILEQCRINGMGAEREATLLGKMERQSAALKLAKEALEDAHQNINPERGYADEIKSDIEKTIAAINEVLKGE
jgi:hypothetical protein